MPQICHSISFMQRWCVQVQSYSLQPTDENAVKLLKENPISRNPSVFRFVELLENVQESCTIAINGDWGTGKTFFVKQVKLVLDAQNPQTVLDEGIRASIKALLPAKIQNIDSYATAYYDAWMYDNDDDPILSLMYATIKSNQSDFSDEKKRSLFNGVAALADALTGRSIGSVLKEARGEDVFASLKSADDIRAMVERFINSLIEERGNRLVIFIDELDRCKPDYAIRFLERIKHYFDDERVTFVFSVSLSQLQCTVKNYYGAEFDATRYLDKFFDLRMSLPEVDYENFMRMRLNFNRITILDDMCIETAKYLSLSLRETERYMRLIKISIQASLSRVPRGFSDENAFSFSALYFIPVLLGLQMTDAKAYSDFITGSNSGPWIKIITSPGINLGTELILSSREYYDVENRQIVSKDIPENTIPIESRLEEVYKIAFSKSYTHSREEMSIGKMCFSENTKRKILEIATLLSPFSVYKDE